MYKRIFISATNTDIGKTYTTKLLIKELSDNGYKVGVIKPIETGVIEYPLDGKELFETALKYNPQLKSLSLDDIVPIQYKLPAAPIVSSDFQDIDYNLIDQKIQKIEKLCDILIIEGAGGIMVPLDKKTFMFDIPLRYKAFTILVTHSGLGCINDSLLNVRFLKSKNLNFKVVINEFKDKDTYHKVSKPYFDFIDIDFLSLQNNKDKIINSILYS